jgi:peptidoglycan/LPS O-acetylase OafA/YrhL
MNKASSRHKGLDALRFVCAAGIVLHHALGEYYPGQGFLLSFVRYSFVYSVNVFFIISGYAIEKSLKDYQYSVMSALKYILRRSIRLDFPYWAMLIAYFSTETITNNRPYGLTDLFYNGIYIQRILNRHEIIGIAWTLCIEVQFYLLMLFVYSISKRSFVRTGLLAIIALITKMTELLLVPHHSGSTVFTYLPWFLVGIIASQKNIVRPAISTTIVVIVLMCQSIGSDYRDQLCIVIYGTLAYTVIMITEEHDNQFLRLLAHFGAYTYSIYLTHMFVIKGLSRIGMIGGPHNYLLASLTITVIAAFALHKFVEKPAMTISRRIQY